jgi:hypothetical protein
MSLKRCLEQEIDGEFVMKYYGVYLLLLCQPAGAHDTTFWSECNFGSRVLGLWVLFHSAPADVQEVRAVIKRVAFGYLVGAACSSAALRQDFKHTARV